MNLKVSGRTLSQLFLRGLRETTRYDPQGSETLRNPHFLDHRLINGGEVVSLLRRPPLLP
jgi:hypothetical protein